MGFSVLRQPCALVESRTGRRPASRLSMSGLWPKPFAERRPMGFSDGLFLALLDDAGVFGLDTRLHSRLKPRRRRRLGRFPLWRSKLVSEGSIRFSASTWPCQVQNVQSVARNDLQLSALWLCGQRSIKRGNAWFRSCSLAPEPLQRASGSALFCPTNMHKPNYIIIS